MNIANHFAQEQEIMERMAKDAQRFVKLRAVATLGGELRINRIESMEKFNAMVDAIDLEEIKLFNLLKNFAELVVFILAFEDYDQHFGLSGFAHDGMGGTGIYKQGFAWRNTAGIAKAKRVIYKKIISDILKHPEYAMIKAMLDDLYFEDEHEDDSSIYLPFNAIALNFFNKLSPLMSDLLYGDLAVNSSKL